MSHQLADFYERELRKLKSDGKALSELKPEIAAILDWEARVDEDPFVRRLVDSFAFLAARLQLKLNDEFSQVATSMLETLLPLWTRPLPSFGIIEFDRNDQLAGKAGGQVVARNTLVEFAGRADVKFSTVYETRCSNLRVHDCQYSRRFTEVPPELRTTADRARSILRLKLIDDGGLPLCDLLVDGFSSLRFYLQPEDLQYELYELLLNEPNVSSIAIATEDLPPIFLPKSSIREVGTKTEESVLEAPLTMPEGYLKIIDLFAFRRKFMFFDLELPEQVCQSKGHQLEIFFFFNEAFDRLDNQLDKNSIRLNCCPVINLSKLSGLNFLVDEFCVDQLIDANQTEQTWYDIFSIDNAQARRNGQPQSLPLYPFFSADQHLVADKNQRFFYSQRVPRVKKDGTDVLFSLVDPSWDPYVQSQFDEIEIDVTVCNRNFLNLQDPVFQTKELRVYSAGVITRAKRVSAAWSRMQLPKDNSISLWNLIALLNLNHLFLSQSKATETLKQLLETLNPFDPEIKTNDFRESRQWIDSIENVTVRPIVDRIDHIPWGGIASGTRIALKLNRTAMERGSYFLLGKLIDHLLAMHTSVNSFTQVSVELMDADSPLAIFPKRCGDRTLI